MRLDIHNEILKRMREKYPDNPAFDEEEVRYGRRRTVDSKFLSMKEVKVLQEIHKEDEFKEDIDDRRQLRALNSLVKLMSGSAKNIKNLQTMEEALKMEIQKLSRHWVFVQDDDAGVMVPYFISGIKYVKPDRYGSTPYVDFDGVAMYRGSHRKFGKHIRRDDLGKNGCTAPALLESIGAYPETDELIEEYQAFLEKYKDICPETGLQLTGTGKARMREDRYSSSAVKLDAGGISSKLVVDDMEERETSKKQDSPAIACALWVAKHGKDGEEADVYRLPVHPYVRTFNLKIHRFMDVHIANVEIYEYETELEKKLVLEDDKRELIDLLVSSGGDDSRDIVKGKSGGVIIVTSGPPGTGKTLTAEVFSEKVERPLYVVQCSQLGTDPDKLEKSLSTVLERASRWNAVLLIDEADVYIHERGDDIQQNAIVGVFLRVLEYYSGVLFMTTNRATVIDDAIVSRCIAHVKYEMPNQDELLELWKILSKQYDVKFTDELCSELVTSFPGISGRSVKQLIRLAKALSSTRGEEITAATIAWVSRFQHIEVQEEVRKKFPVLGGK